MTTIPTPWPGIPAGWPTAAHLRWQPLAKPTSRKQARARLLFVPAVHGTTWIPLPRISPAGAKRRRLSGDGGVLCT